MIGAIVRLARWFWSAWLVYLGLMALFLLGLLLSDGAWWSLPLSAFFAFVAYVQVRKTGGVTTEADVRSGALEAL